MSDRPGEMDERDVDQRFASIVAAWDRSAEDATADPAAPTPGTVETEPDDAPERASASRDDPTTDPTAGPAAGGADAPASPPRPSPVNPSPLAGLVPGSSWRVVQPPSSGAVDPPATTSGPDDDEHFEPPTVQLPPQEDLHFWGAVLGLVAGPLCLIYVAMARPFHSTRWFLAGLGLSLLGFALLVLRQPKDRDDGDDGARV